MHNLQALDLDIPLRSLVVLTGPSGSGKSSLAFDTIFAEGQRRLVELLSPAARRLADVLPRPDVDLIEGLPPTLACEQAPPRWGAYSTVATAMDMAHGLALLFLRCADLHCTACDAKQGVSTVPQMVDRLMELDEGARFVVAVPLEERAEQLELRNHPCCDEGRGSCGLDVGLTSHYELSPTRYLKSISSVASGLVRVRSFTSVSSALFGTAR